MTTTLHPTTASDVIDIVQAALTQVSPLDVQGGASKQDWGKPRQAAMSIDTTGLSGILFYEPEELVLKARAGTRMDDIDHALNARGQMLAFEPADYRTLLGSTACQPTLGGIIACNLSGPRRVKAGAARDHVLGVQAVTGRGEQIETGSRVVKNVTGYDLPKLLTGSRGTLGVMTEITVKALPAPERSATLAWAGLDDDKAVALLSQAIGSPHEVGAAAHLPADCTANGQALTLVRVEGFSASVAARVQAVCNTLPNGRLLDDDEGALLWRQIRDVLPLVEPTQCPVWRLSVAPMQGPAVLAQIRAALPGTRGYYDWAGGLVWVAVPDGVADAGAAIVRQATGSGHASLLRAPLPIRALEGGWRLESPALAALNQQIKHAFDPHGVFV